jgi:hypothetical protein
VALTGKRRLHRTPDGFTHPENQNGDRNGSEQSASQNTAR